MGFIELVWCDVAIASPFPDAIPSRGFPSSPAFCASPRVTASLTFADLREIDAASEALLQRAVRCARPSLPTTGARSSLGLPCSEAPRTRGYASAQPMRRTPPEDDARTDTRSSTTHTRRYESSANRHESRPIRLHRISTVIASSMVSWPCSAMLQLMATCTRSRRITSSMLPSKTSVGRRVTTANPSECLRRTGVATFPREGTDGMFATSSRRSDDRHADGHGAP